MRETLDILGRIFPFRKCRGARPGRSSGSPCLQYHIKRCLAPCVDGITSEEYAVVVDRVVDFLSGRHARVAGDIEAEMREASAALDFERAALYRDRLEALQHVLRAPAGAIQRHWATRTSSAWRWTSTAPTCRCSSPGTASSPTGASFSLVNVEGATPSEVFERFVGEYYSTALVVPPEVIVPRSVGGLEGLSTFLEGLRGTKVNVRTAERGDKRRLQELADRNAALALEHDRLRAERTREHRYGALTALQEVLGLAGPPMRIEGYDISNLGPEHIVASMVVFEGGVPRKSDYRNVRHPLDRRAGRRGLHPRGPAPPVHSRRRACPTPAAYDPSFEAVPDLVLIDGGKGQLGAAVAALTEAGLDEVVPGHVPGQAG